MPIHHQLDHETALSAVRNLNGSDVGGRPLRIDLADSDPFLEGKTTVRGELLDGGYPGPSEPRARGSRNAPQSDPESFLASLPTGKPVPPGASALDGISQTLASMPPSQLMEVLAQFKAFVITHPDQARTLLIKHPQFSYALFQSLLLNKIVDSAILERMLASSRGPGGTPPMHPPPPPAARPPVPAPPAHLQGYHPPQTVGYPPPFPPHQPGVYPPPQNAGPPAAQPYYRPLVPGGPPAPGPPAAPAIPEIPEKDRAMLMQVLSLTPDQINGLAEKDRTAIIALRNQFMGQLGTTT